MITGTAIKEQLEKETAPGAESPEAQCLRLGIDVGSVTDTLVRCGFPPDAIPYTLGGIVVGVELGRVS